MQRQKFGQDRSERKAQTNERKRLERQSIVVRAGLRRNARRMRKERSSRVRRLVKRRLRNVVLELMAVCTHVDRLRVCAMAFAALLLEHMRVMRIRLYVLRGFFKLFIVAVDGGLSSDFQLRDRVGEIVIGFFVRGRAKPIKTDRLGALFFFDDGFRTYLARVGSVKKGAPGRRLRKARFVLKFASGVGFKRQAGIDRKCQAGANDRPAGRTTLPRRSAHPT